MKCNHKDCTCEATKVIRFSLAVHDNHPPAISTPVMWFCDEHSKGLKFDDLVGDDGWKTICAGFEAAGKMAPVKKYCKLVIDKIPINPQMN